MLVRIRNAALVEHQAGHGRNSQSDGIIEQVAKNEQVELLGRRVDGRNRLTVSVGKISRMICLLSDLESGHSSGHAGWSRSCQERRGQRESWTERSVSIPFETAHSGQWGGLSMGWL